jgi:hypothetical protein
LPVSRAPQYAQRVPSSRACIESPLALMCSSETIVADGRCGAIVDTVQTDRNATAGPMQKADRASIPSGLCQPRRRNANRDFFWGSATGTTYPSAPNAVVLSLARRSAAGERGAPMTIGTPSLTAFR